MKKILLLGVVVAMLAFGLVLMSCTFCPGGRTVSSPGDCRGSRTTGIVLQCEDTCITVQSGKSAQINFYCDC